MSKKLAKATPAGHAARDHSKISPSKLKPLKTCPGWENIEGDSGASLRGTFLHEIMETGKIPAKVPDEVDTKDIAMAEKILATLREEEKHSPFEPIKELELDFRPLGFDGFEKGHLDRTLVIEVDADENPVGAELTDFKFGEWEVEPVKDNIQFRSYGLGLFLEFPTLDWVKMRLFQPALNKDESYVLRRNPDVEMIKSQIGAIVKRRHKFLETRDASMLRSDPENCGFCAAQATCPVWQAYQVRLANESNLFEVPVAPIEMLDDPESADPEEAIRIFRWVKPMEDYLKKVKKFVLAVYDTGRLDHGVTLIEKAGSTSITDPLAIFEQLKEHYGVTAEEFIAACTVSVGTVETLVSDRTEHGGKGAATKEFIAALRGEGLIVSGDPIRYLQVSRKKQ